LTINSIVGAVGADLAAVNVIPVIVTNNVPNISLPIYDACIRTLIVGVGGAIVDNVLSTTAVVIAVVAIEERTIGPRIGTATGIVKVYRGAAGIGWTIIVRAVPIFDATGKQEAGSKCGEYEQ
jgi:hypothetical protein